MSKSKKIILLTLILIGSTLILKKDELNNELKGVEKKNYNIYKEEEKSTSRNLEGLTDITNLTLMSYNIHRGKDYQDKYSLEEIMNFLKESDADIICLQEVLFSQHSLIRESAKYKSQFVTNIKIPIASTGLATYSKYPIIESNHIKLTSKTEARGALHTAFRIDNKLINVINVHLGLDKKEREIQIKEIVEYSKDLEGEIILAGDFNQKKLEIDNFRDIGKYHGYGGKDTFFPLKARIDYIFMTTENVYSTNYKNLEIYLSDHYPIMANIRYIPSKDE